MDFNSSDTQIQYVVYLWTNLLTEGGNLLDEQRSNLSKWLQENSLDGTNVITAEFVDNHLKRTKPKNFPELGKAVQFAISNKAKLIVVKLDNLLKQDKFAELLQTEALDFICIDKPLVTPSALAIVRQYVKEQSKQHGNSIKKGLRVSQNKLGNPNAKKAITSYNKIKTENAVLFALFLEPIITKYQNDGFSQRKIVEELNKEGILAPEGGEWVLSQLQKVIKRIETNKLAIEVKDYQENNQLQQYSASELITALNSTNIRPAKYEAWDEELLTAVLARKRTIQDVVDLYDFMYKHEQVINKLLLDGMDLEQMADYLNAQQIPVPEVIAREVE